MFSNIYNTIHGNNRWTKLQNLGESKLHSTTKDTTKAKYNHKINQNMRIDD